jgi:S1-C subfamily serine protease
MSDRWYYAKDKKKHGPLPAEELRALLRRGVLRPTDMVLQEGTVRWVPASTLPESPPQEAAPPSLVRRCAKRTLKGLAEVPRSFVAVGSQVVRSLGYWGCKRRESRLGRRAREAQLDLGRALVAHKLGDPRQRQQLAAAEETLRIIRQARGSAGKALQERDQLLLNLSERWLRATNPPPGLEAEQRRAVEAERAWRHQQQARARSRATLFPVNRAGRARVWAGGGMLAALLVAGGLLLVPGSTPAEREGEAIAAATPTRDSVNLANHEKADRPTQVSNQPEQSKKTDPPVPEPAPPARKSLKELYRQLSIAVPMVETPGAGGGSGFLVRHKGRYLVVTNRHVVEPARNGLQLFFLRTTKQGQEERLEIPSGKIKLVAVHRTVDLALIDITAAADELAKWKIEPVVLAKSDHVPEVGDHVFAIGHPGDAAGGVLTRTLSDGIVSAVNRKDRFAQGSFTQVTVAINPGNSGGPIFDDEGKVIAVATFIIRRNKERDLTLEALNFGLDTRFVHELLDDPAKSLTQAEIAAGFSSDGPLAAPPKALVEQATAKLKRLLAQGYRPFTGNLKTSTFPFRLMGDTNRGYTLQRLSPRDQMYIFVVSHGSEDVDLHVFDRNKRLVVQDIRVNPDPEVAFRPRFMGDYFLVISNLTPQPAEGVMVVLVK